MVAASGMAARVDGSGSRPTPNERLRTLTGYASIALAAVLFGVAGAVAKALFHANVSPVALTALRAFMAVVVLAPAVAITYRMRLAINSRQTRYLLVMGALLTLVNVTFYYAISQTQVAVAILLEYTAPVFVVLIGLARGTHVLNRVTTTVLCMGAAGCFLLTGAYSFDWAHVSLIGIGIGLACGLCFAIYNLWGNRAERLQLSNTMVTFYSFLFSASIWVVGLPALGLTTVDYRPTVLAYLFFIGVFATVLPYWLLNRGLRSVDAFPATVVGMLDPVVAGAAAFVMLGEILQPLQIAGVVVLLVTLGYMKLNDRALVRSAPRPSL
jgi:drug/metabolite transporter, DME family